MMMIMMFQDNDNGNNINDDVTDNDNDDDAYWVEFFCAQILVTVFVQKCVDHLGLDQIDGKNHDDDEDDYEDDYDNVDNDDLRVEVCRPHWISLEHVDHDDNHSDDEDVEDDDDDAYEDDVSDDKVDDYDYDDCNIYLNDMPVNFSAHHPVSYFPELFAINLVITTL